MEAFSPKTTSQIPTDIFGTLQEAGRLQTRPWGQNSFFPISNCELIKFMILQHNFPPFSTTFENSGLITKLTGMLFYINFLTFWKPNPAALFFTESCLLHLICTSNFSQDKLRSPPRTKFDMYKVISLSLFILYNTKEYRFSEIPQQTQFVNNVFINVHPGIRNQRS